MWGRKTSPQDGCLWLAHVYDKIGGGSRDSQYRARNVHHSVREGLCCGSADISIT